MEPNRADGDSYAPPRPGLAGFVRAVGASATWQKLLSVEALALLLGWIEWLEHRPGSPASAPAGVTDAGLFLASVTSYSFAVMVIFLSALCAEQLVERGARAKLTYFGMLTITSIAVAAALPSVRGWFGPQYLPAAHDWQHGALRAVDVGIYGGYAMWIYLNRRSCNRMLDAVRSTERHRAQLERQLIESRIASTQARIDPGVLFATLENIREDFRAGTPGAEQDLEALIQRLRAALGRADGVAVGAGQP